MTNRVSPTFNPLKTGTSTAVQPFPYIGFVKNNIDPQNMGRLSVWIPEICGDPLDPGSWIICSYMSPFAGATNINTLAGYQTNTSVSQQSYGWVGVPPDLNSEVMVVFVAGDVSRAYWIGCTYQQNMDYMVPGIAVGTTTANPPAQAPVIEYNKANIQGSVAAPRRPIFVPLANGLTTEGLSGDPERGGSTTSMRRESPPLVYGYLTPRGNTIHVDDNANNSNEFIRFRTRSGTQILIHETTGYIYINSKLGNSWAEISDNGINFYTGNSLSMRAQEDFNIRADGNVNIDAGINVNIRAGQQITLNAAGSNIQMNANTNINLTAANIEVGASMALNLSSGGTGSIGTTNDLLINSGGNLRLQSTQDTSSLSVHGNWYRAATEVYDSPDAQPGGPPSQITVPTVTPATTPSANPQLDTTQTFQNGGSGGSIWTHGGSTINTIVPIMPTHEPWFGHPRASIPPVPASGLPVQFAGTNQSGIPGTPGAPPAATPGQPPPGGPLAQGACSFGVANTKPIATAVFNAISNACTKTGADAATMFAFADIESSFNPNAGANSSSASGLYQFIGSTWTSMIAQYGNEYNVPTGTSVFDVNANALMGGAYLGNNSQILQKAGISTPTPGELYLMHFLGSGGGQAMIAANTNNPSASAASLFPSAASANKTIFYNSDGSAKTVSQVYDTLTNFANSKAAAYANQFGLTAPCQRGMGVAGNSPSTAAPSANTDFGAYQDDVGQIYGSGSNRGQCVALVQAVAGVGNTHTWQQGDNVQQLVNNGGSPPIGTPIATFGSNGTYTNSLDGTSHAAIYLGPAPNNGGIQVLDQYVGSDGQPVPAKIHTIPWSGGSQVISNASNYSIINTPTS
jgi:hypothetical protein